ncbi:YfcE family phosphodiesterase [Candidatus Fermentibacteria bacterium]|nr:YfcE family phosphodiesterase [Candidatus Fermentibacteria bacterium]
MEFTAIEKNPATITILANTHGSIPDNVIEALRGSDLIVHAGDIGGAGTLDALRALGSVAAVRGNSDRQPPLSDLPEMIVIAAGEIRILVVHNHSRLAWPPEGIHVVVSGLWHQPSTNERDGVLVVSPGSAAPGWAAAPVSIVRLTVGDHGVEPTVVRIDASGGA